MWSLTIPASTVETFDQTAEMVLDREKANLSRVGATHAAGLAVATVKEILRVWDVSEVPGRTFGAVLGGQANPGGNAPDGFGNDAITIKLWRSG